MAEETVAKESMEAEYSGNAEQAAEAPAEAAAPVGPALTDIEGVGEKTAEGLREAGYDTVEKIAAMSDDEMMTIPGIGEVTAQKILQSARTLMGW